LFGILIHSRSIKTRHPALGQISIGRVGQFSVGLNTEVYEAAKATHPERWSGDTRNWEPVTTVHLNPEKGVTEAINEKEEKPELKKAA
jgi:putative transposase